MPAVLALSENEDNTIGGMMTFLFSAIIFPDHSSYIFIHYSISGACVYFIIDYSESIH